MFKLVTLYRRVDDVDALEDFFSQTHLPLAERLPGLLKSEICRIHGKPGGESRFHLMYELYFATEESYRLAMLSQVGQRLVEALVPWDQAGILTWFQGEVFEEERR